MSVPGQEWRALVAALANEDLRTDYARIVLGDEPLRGRSTAQLVQAGLLELHDGHPRPAADLRSMLADRSAERPQRGPLRFLRPDGSIDRYPSQRSDREDLLRFVAAVTIGPDETVTEPALNDRLRRFDPDTAALRRSLVDHGILERSTSGSEYRTAAARD